MIAGFHTSALAEHDLATAGALLRRIGYGAMAVRLSLARLDPLADGPVRAAQIESLGTGLRGLRLVLDADGRYLVDPWSSEPVGFFHGDADADRQFEYLRGAIDVAGEFGGGFVTFSTGRVPTGMEVQEAMDRLSEGSLALAEFARAARVTLCIRPRPGHFIDTLGRFERLTRWTGGDPDLWLAADVAAMVAGGEMPVVELLRRTGPRLRCVYLSDVHIGAGASGGKGNDGDCWIGGGHVSAARVRAGLSVEGFTGPVLVEPSETARIDPEGAAELYRRIFIQ